MLRFSTYTILSELLSSGGHVLMNGCSGAMDVVPDSLAKFIQQVVTESPHGEAYVERAALRQDTLQSFIDAGHLTELSHAEEQRVLSELARGMHDVMTDKPHFMIAPNMDCNYRCTYCFERHIQKKLKSDQSNISYWKDNVVMQRDFVPRIYDCIGQLQSKAEREPGGMVILYGGEPLDVDNLDLLFDIVYSGVERGFWFAAITNGHDLDKFLPIIRPDMLNQIQVSIDGPKRVHDKRRIHRGKESSFDRILGNVNTVVNKGGAEMQIRVHVDPTNIGLFEETLAVFEDEGWLNNPNVVIYSNTVYDKSKDGKVCVGLEVGDIGRTLSEIASQYDNVFTSAPAVHASRAMLPVFKEGGRFALKSTYCSANTGNYIFAPDGQIYACWESIGKDCSRIGSYMDAAGLILEETAVKRWFNRCVVDIPDCMECAFALVCGGGCAQYAEYNSGSLYKPYCDDFQRTFRITLAERADSYLSCEASEWKETPVRVGGDVR